VPFDKVEENIYAFGWSKGRVVLLVRPIGVVEAGEYLSNPFHPGQISTLQVLGQRPTSPEESDRHDTRNNAA
jgi:hypothetical protein